MPANQDDGVARLLQQQPRPGCGRISFITAPVIHHVCAWLRRNESAESCSGQGRRQSAADSLEHAGRQDGKLTAFTWSSLDALHSFQRFKLVYVKFVLYIYFFLFFFWFLFLATVFDGEIKLYIYKRNKNKHAIMSIAALTTYILHYMLITQLSTDSMLMMFKSMALVGLLQSTRFQRRSPTAAVTLRTRIDR